MSGQHASWPKDSDRSKPTAVKVSVENLQTDEPLAKKTKVYPRSSDPSQCLSLVETDMLRRSDHDCTISFGPFRLLATQRVLLEGDRPVRLGSRALDIPIALVGRPGELVSKRELMDVVWPDTVVVEANLTVHVTALRRALGDGQAGNRYIVNIPGRGYRFVAPVTFPDEPRSLALRLATPAAQHNLPAQLTRLIGRAEIVSNLMQQLPLHRLLTIVGPASARLPSPSTSPSG